MLLYIHRNVGEDFKKELKTRREGLKGRFETPI